MHGRVAAVVAVVGMVVVAGASPSSGSGLNNPPAPDGRTTGYSCGTVYDESVAFTFQWEGCGYCVVTAYDMVEVAGATSDDGDSGGPWFSGNTAYGIHTGFNLISGHKFFSKVQNAEIQFGVTVMMA